MTGYRTVTVIVEGALDQEREFSPWPSVAASDAVSVFLDSVYNATLEDGKLTEVYILDHDHTPTEDGACGCIQYATDHRPAFVWGGANND